MRKMSVMRLGLFVLIMCMGVSIGYAQQEAAIEGAPAAAAPAAPVPITIFPQVSEGADAVVVIPSLRQLSDKASILAKQVGMGMMLGPDPLMTLKAMSSMMVGLDDNANVAVVINKLDNALNMGDPDKPLAEPAVVVVLPVTTLDEFMGNFVGRSEKLPNGMTRITPMMEGEDVLLIKPLGEKHVLVSNSAANLLSYKAANADQWSDTQGKIATDYLTRGDVVALFNPRTLAKMLNENMDDIRKSMKESLDEAQVENPEMLEFRPLIEFYVDLLLKGSQAFLNDTTGMAVCLTINDAGISTGMSVQFAKDSNLNQIFATAPDEMGDFKLLPQLPWVSLTKFDCGNLKQELLLSLVKQMIPGNEIVPEVGRPAVEAFNKLMDEYKLYNYPYEQMNVANMIGQTQIITAVDSGDESQLAFEQIRKASKPGIELFNTILTNVPKEGVGEFKLSYTENAKEVPGATATDYISFAGTGMMATALQQSFGKPNVDVQVSYNDDGIVSVLGDEEMLKQALTAIKERKVDEKTKAIVDAIRPNLPANRMMESYMSLPNYLTQIQAALLRQPQGMQIAVMMGMFQLPADLPPIVTTGSNVDGGVRMDSFVPSATITTVAQKFMMMFQMIQGANGMIQNAPVDQGLPSNVN